MYHWNIKFQEKIFTCKKVIQLWNFGNFGISEIIPKTLVTLRFLKVSLHELESNCKCFQMRYWPIFYIHPTHNSTHFSTWPGRKITNAHDCILTKVCFTLGFLNLKESFYIWLFSRWSMLSISAHVAWNCWESRNFSSVLW